MARWLRSVAALVVCGGAWGCLEDPSLDDGHQFPTDDSDIVAKKAADEDDEAESASKGGQCIGAGCPETNPEGDASTPSPAPSPAPGPTGGCAAPAPCSAATDLGAVSGDTGNDERSRQGSSSQWLSVRVTEDAAGVLGAQMKVTATLVSPAGANFDLYLYADACGGEPVASSKKASGTTDQATFAWGEGALPNGDPDDKTILVEVRHVAGDCAPTDKWTLIVGGN